LRELPKMKTYDLLVMVADGASNVVTLTVVE
jgi:hypothetical protein